MTIDTDVIRRSVTAEDHSTAGRAMPPMFFVTPTMYSIPRYADLLPYWSRDRDFQLRGTVHRESMWAAAIGKAITKRAALGWTIADTDDSKVRTQRAQQLYLHADAGRGWVRFIQRHLRDYLTTDNGAFVEIVRASAGVGSRILGIVHLDSCRCTRTDDPARPVLYRDRIGREHVLRDHQVLTFADMPESGEQYNGVGMCAASRAWYTIAKLSALEQYGYEKLTGDGATEITFLHGLQPQQLQDAIRSTDEQKAAKGAVYYKGKIVVPVMGDVPLSEVTIGLKNVPDGFDPKQIEDRANVIYANAIGVPVQEVAPLSGQGLGTGTQSVILAEEAEGYGLAAWGKDWEQQQNEKILPESTTFSWTNTHDLRDQKAQAEVKQMRATTRASQINSGEISPAIARQLAVDAEDIPRELVADVTPGGQLSDDQKPVDTPVNPALAGQYPLPTEPAGGPRGGQLPAGIPRAKDDEQGDEAAARALFVEVFGG